MALRELANARKEIVLPRYNRWLAKHQQDPYPVWVADIIHQEMTKQGRRRTGTLSASSGGKCLRQQIFGYLGVEPSKKVSTDLLKIFDAGTWIHLKHQANLLSAGIIDKIEVALPWMDKRVYGTADGMGIVPDDHPVEEWRGLEFGLEIKSMNSYKWDYYNKKSKLDANYQTQNDRYMIASGWPLFTFVCENKDTGKLFEIVRVASECKFQDSIEEVEILNEHIDNQRLPKVQFECEREEGDFKSCMFAEICKEQQWRKRLGNARS